MKNSNWDERNFRLHFYHIIGLVKFRSEAQWYCLDKNYAVSLKIGRRFLENIYSQQMIALAHVNIFVE